MLMRQASFLLLSLFIPVYWQITPVQAVEQSYQEQRNKPIGLSVVNNLESYQRVGRLFSQEVYVNPRISGVTFRTSWADINPKEGEFDWEKLDTVLQKAEAHHKWVELILIPGFGAPEWIYEKGIQFASFPISYGRGKGEKFNLPLPWDQKYLNSWVSFLEKVSQRYGSRPSFVKIAACGPTSVSAEASLPGTKEDIRVWQKLGYTPEKYINAWRETFQAYALLFPRQYFSLALHPALPIGDRGQISKNEREEVRQAIIEEGMRFPGQFVLQTDGLNAVKGERGGYRIVKSYSGKIITGFMMSSAFTQKTQKYGNALQALRSSLELGLEADPWFIELYEADVLNPAMQELLKRPQEILLNKQSR